MQATRNKMPAACVYLLENLYFLQFFVADSVPGSIIVSKKNQIMEQDYREKLTSVEQLALFVEQKCNMGNAAWAVVYFLAALVLLPAVLILSTGTGMAIWAYLTEGLYEAEGYTGTTTLAIKMPSTLAQRGGN